MEKKMYESQQKCVLCIIWITFFSLTTQINPQRLLSASQCDPFRVLVSVTSEASQFVLCLTSQGHLTKKMKTLSYKSVLILKIQQMSIYDKSL